ncbi:MAG: hypothetical protein C0614_00715 [Desulfuromonas sp.]|nr:MAG: hypothetical protein C0614_00715 [Desulfuromonas sp.]
MRLFIFLLFTLFLLSSLEDESIGATSHSLKFGEHGEKKADLSIGKDVYERTCASCHNLGISGAIKINDKEAWKKHIHHGIDHMVESVIRGKGAMPARGGNPNLTDEEIEAAVHYIIKQAQ